MELEGQWWKGQLAGDIYHALRYKELRLPVYKGQSPQLNLRRYFADLIAIVSNRFRLCPSARHLAVYLLDIFMDRYDISVQQLHMVALSCLLLASKFEEREDRVPKLETLNSLACMSSMNLVLTKQGLLHMELLLLESFHWNLYLPTAAHFIEYYLSIAVNEADLHDGWPMACLEKTMLYMNKYADYFLEVSLQDHAFLQFAPSLIAAACVASSRVILRLAPTWPPRLQRLAAYTWEQLLPCVERLLLAHDSDVKEANKQKCQLQQLGPQPGQAMYPTQSQSATVAQYIHRPALQYTQQSCQPVLVSAHASSAYLCHSGPLQASSGRESSAPLQDLQESSAPHQDLLESSAPQQSPWESSAPSQGVPKSSSLSQSIPCELLSSQSVPVCSSLTQSIPVSSYLSQRVPVSSFPLQRVPVSSSLLQRVPMSSSPLQRVPKSTVSLQSSPELSGILLCRAGSDSRQP